MEDALPLVNASLVSDCHRTKKRPSQVTSMALQAPSREDAPSAALVSLPKRLHRSKAAHRIEHGKGLEASETLVKWD